MKTILLIIVFAIVITVGVMYNVPELREFRDYLWIPIAIGFCAFVLMLLHKDSNNEEKAK